VCSSDLLPSYSNSPPAEGGNFGFGNFLGFSGNTLVDWLGSHGQGYYLGTPYIPYQNGADARNPIGDPYVYNPSSTKGMNCGGFIWHVLYKVSGHDISQLGGGVGSSSAITTLQRLCSLHYTYPSKEALLADGKAQKGDIVLILTPDSAVTGKPDDLNHIGFFWGNTPGENLMWHQTSSSYRSPWSTSPGNIISGLEEKVSGSKWVLYKLSV
jgi:hypothetical protein